MSVSFDLISDVSSVNVLERPSCFCCQERSLDITAIAQHALAATVEIMGYCETKTLYNSHQVVPYFMTASGFCIHPDGYIITNYHVVDGLRRVDVLFRGGKKLEAEIVGVDPETDLALLKIEKTDCPYLVFADRSCEIGETVFTTGNPLGLRRILTKGVISAKADCFADLYSSKDSGDHLGQLAHYLVSDALTNPGSSGGPLLDRQGHVIGVQSRGGSGHAISIAQDTVISVANELIDQGVVRRSWLGCEIESVPEILLTISDKEGEALVLLDVLEGSPAEIAGLQKGDIILKSNGNPIRSKSQFLTDIAIQHPPGSCLSLSILRGKQLLAVDVILGSRILYEPVFIKELGLSVEALDYEKKIICRHDSKTQGLFISEVECGSLAELAGLLPGDVILSVGYGFNDQKPLVSVEELEETMSEVKDFCVLKIQGFDRTRSFYRVIEF
jgi:serine protease Do